MHHLAEKGDGRATNEERAGPSRVVQAGLPRRTEDRSSIWATRQPVNSAALFACPVGLRQECATSRGRPNQAAYIHKQVSLTLPCLGYCRTWRPAGLQRAAAQGRINTPVPCMRWVADGARSMAQRPGAHREASTFSRKQRREAALPLFRRAAEPPLPC